jgi:hypothetical protein
VTQAIDPAHKLFDMIESRGQRITSGGMSAKLDGLDWVFRQYAYCACGNEFSSQAFFDKDGSDEERKAVIKSLMDHVQDKWWECYKSHQGEFGLDAIDGSI